MDAAGRVGSGPVDQWTLDNKVAMLPRISASPHPRISASLHLHSVIMMHGIGGKAAGPRRDSRMSDTMIKEEILLSTSSPSWRKYTGAVRCRLTWVLCDRGVEANV